jgi:hypothetical protein
MNKSLALFLILLSVPAFAQTDFSGEWTRIQEEDSSLNPDIGDWFGIPMNAAALRRAETWDPSSWTLPEWQCRPHGGSYFKREPAALQITKEMDPVTREIKAYHAEWLRQVRIPIYLDGRPHPSPNAPHNWLGFSTAVWEGDMLKAHHLTAPTVEVTFRKNNKPMPRSIRSTSRGLSRGGLKGPFRDMDEFKSKNSVYLATLKTFLESHCIGLSGSDLFGGAPVRRDDGIGRR